jgi:hypothetical protein
MTLSAAPRAVAHAALVARAALGVVKLPPQRVRGACACSASVAAFAQSASLVTARLRACVRSVRAHVRAYRPTKRSGAGACQQHARMRRRAASSHMRAHRSFRRQRKHLLRVSVRRRACRAACVRATAAPVRVRRLPLTRRRSDQRPAPPPCGPRGRPPCAQASPALGAPCSSRRRSGTRRSA